ncbi:squamosa promoter-binding-like protein 1 isoform X2 [Phragmites australis]|uniref:squamosa promoter-binding-like protein 1 isoform X2 n=1 Tax=Phragmites australis TaxID=29695 RepID=UPI002D79B48A|nr:squamosa promoter-binding-like protein 1 isoform X2 [Phragmites australis]
MEAGFLWKENGDQTDAARMAGGLKNKSLEWDLNDWRWDANLFLATPVGAAPSECSSRELSQAQGEIDFGVGVDKRRRVSPEDGSAGCSNSALANGDSHVVSVQRARSNEERPRKGACSSSPPSCQVDGCQADLSGARDYHKRHKVCEAHTRSSVVRIKSVEHRFCQQCSRFHLLQEFDEGKKSCRSRLARHNGRRRKVQPQAGVDANSMNENQSLSSTLLLLLKQLSGLESGSSSEQINHPNYLVNLLKNLAAIASTQAYQDMLKNANSTLISSNAGNNVANDFTVHEQTRRPIPVGPESSEEPPVKRRVQDFDLNDVYIEEVESRTDKIVFKLFGKEPTDFPVDLRAQILNWLSHYPSDMESYIRPGCVILTVYLCLPNWMWDELDDDPAPWIEKLISMSNDGFWRTGWVYARVQDCLTLSCNGSLMLASPWQPVIGDKHQRLCVTPIAVACSSTANFSVKGYNIVQPTTKLLCIFGEKYLIQEETQMLLEDTTMQQGPQCLTFSCSFPSISGRGFIEVEDYDQSSLSVPFVVTEEDVCSEIRMLEHELSLSSFDETLEGIDDLMASRNRALHFLQEIGWLLQRSHMRATSKQPPQYCTEGFPVARFRWLLSFAINQEWCAVIRKLLNTMFQGDIDLDVLSPVEFSLGEDLLLTATKKRSKPLVDFLLRYTPTNHALVYSGDVAPDQFLFTPDMTGPSNITPLHIAATMNDATGVLDALTDDPQQLGIKAWKNARDATGFTPEDYARKRGHISYIKMVQDKIDSRIPKAHVSVAIPSGPSTTNAIGKHAIQLKSTDQTTFDVEKGQQSIKQPLSCRQCVQHLGYHPRTNRFLSNRSAVLSLVAIAAVCVCVGLLMKSPPQVGIMKPFLWDHINWGPK